MYVDENGRCEFDTDRKQRFAEAARAALIAVTGFQPKVAAEHLNTLGIRTPRGSCWSPGTIVQMRERFASA